MGQSIIYRDAYRAIAHLTGKAHSQTDRVAVNTITEFIKAAEKAQDQKMKPYLKLYLYLFREFTQHYDELPDAKEAIAQKELHRILDRDYDQMVYEFTSDLNLMLLERSMQYGQKPMHEPYNAREVANNLKAQALKAFLKYQKQ